MAEVAIAVGPTSSPSGEVPPPPPKKPATVPPPPPPKLAASSTVLPEEGPEEPMPATPTTPEDSLSGRAKRALRGRKLTDFAVQTPV